MTPTELEKLEALHAAATPGEWRADIDRDRLTVDLTSYQQTGDEPHDWIAPYVAGFEASDGGVADCEAIAAIHNAFPAMAKALREAWSERDDAIRLGDERLATLWDEKKAEIAKIAAERDEAREALEAMVLNCRYGCNRDSNCGVCAIALEAMPNGWPAQSEDE